VSAGAFKIQRLASGGLMTNYACTSRCRHCLYNCSPDWPGDYITANEARLALQTIQSLGCEAVHIGGGEPFLRPAGLAATLKAAGQVGVRVDYVETNASWYRDAASATATLARLREHGLRTLLVSISPFHNEHIPYARVLGVMTAARETGIRLFPWIEGFVPDLEAFDHRRPHRLSEFDEQFGRDYLRRALQRYWIHPGGRALNLLRKLLPVKPAGCIVEQAPGGCTPELTDTTHFHIDLFGNYIPGLCSGLTIRRQDLGRELEPEAYPLLSRLYQQGIGGLLRWATARYDFQPDRRGYLNKCDLCTDIRTFLATAVEEDFPELRPSQFYTPDPGVTS
jgi:hypothetical protein